MTDRFTDPFEALAAPDRPLDPRPDFARALRARLVAALADSIPLPDRRPTVTTATATATAAPAVVPYLCVAGADRALEWYGDVFGAVASAEPFRDTDGRIGHVEFRIGDAEFYMSDEYPDYGVGAPNGPASVTLHMLVADVDRVYAQALGAGATGQRAPEDQPYGERSATIVDPFGHRWMLAQPLGAAAPAAPPRGAIWASLNYADAPAGIALLTDVFGFRAELVVTNPADPSVIEHSQLVWPEGGVVQAGTARRTGNPYADRPTGAESLYVVTADPHAVWERCRAAGVEVVQPPMTPDYAPDTMVFSVRDREGNIFSFGSYAGEPGSH